MAAAISLLLAAMWAGLIRIGWGLPALRSTLPALHGPLMVVGFLGTLIGLERAVGSGKRWALAGPALTASGALIALAGFTSWLGPLLVTLGSLVVLTVLVGLVRLHVALFSVTIALGGATWVIGNLVWLLGQPIPLAVLWWMGFLVFTIAGERLELSRILRLSTWAQRSFLAIVVLLLIGMSLGMFDFGLAMRVTGLGLAAMAIWLLRYDIARRRIKAGGQARFIAISLLSGYVWLAVGGLLAIWYGGVMAGPAYDAILHTVFLGFVITMIFAHAPIVFPAVLQLPVVYTPRFYSHLILLDVTLLLRVAGDLLLWPPGRLWGGLLNVAVVLLFLVNTVTSLRPRAGDRVAAPGTVHQG